MGQAIVYCSNCSAQVRGADFESGRAFKVEELIFCSKCYREVLGTEPPRPALSPSSTKVKSLPASSSSPSKSSSSTNRIPIATHPAPPSAESGSLRWVLPVLGVAVIGILIAVATSGGGDRRELPSHSSSAPPSVSAPAPLPRPSTQETAAQEALAKAIRFAGEHPQDVVAQRALFAEAAARAAGTPILPDARRELDRADRKVAELRASEFSKLEKSAKGTKTDEAVALWRAARGKFDDPSWTESVDRKIRDLEFVPPVPAPAPVEPKPDPAPVAPAPPREDPSRQRWEVALSPLAARDYAAAIAALEKGGDAADLQLLRSVAALHQEALLALTRTPKGQKVALEYRDGTGQARRLEGSFVEEENGRVELRGESGSVDVDVGEILPSSLADHLRNRGGTVDPAVAAVYCLLEGDEAPARRLAGDRAGTVPEKYWTYAQKVAATRAAPDTARGLYQEARALANGFATAADAVPKYQALLRDHAESPFVRRNKASLAARAQQCARDYLFLAADLNASGSFKAARSAKGSACWTSDADADAVKMKENFLELSYSVLPDTAYKCWIYAGACCQETFEFFVQGTEMLAPAGKGKEREAVEPGSGLAAEVKPWLSTLKKTHSMHSGPKQPAHWEWIPISLPKYAKPGLQRVRVLTDQKGFSVAFACVTATRTGPPREPDLRELEKTRGDRPAPAAVPAPKATVLFALALDGTDRRLQGEYRDKALYGTNQFNSCFAGVEGNPVFTAPAQGELRFTYFLSSVTPLKVRCRVSRGGASAPYDAAVLQPVAGRPTEVRIPLSEFKQPSVPNSPPLPAGDAVVCIYITGQDLACGLRIDALSVVELQAGAPAKAVVALPSKVVFSENFDNGCGKFQGGESVDGGVKGSKAISIPPKGVSVWGAWSVPAKESVVFSFKLKALADIARVEIMAWSESQQDNGRFHIDNLKKGDWQEVRFKASELRLGWARDGPPVNVVESIVILLPGAPADARLLLDDFEIRQ